MPTSSSDGSRVAASTPTCSIPGRARRSIACASAPSRTRREAEKVDEAARAGREVQALDYALAVLAGVLFVLSFPKFGHPAIGWLALVPLLVALARSSGVTRHRAVARRSSWPSSRASSASPARLYWTADVMVVFGGLPSVAAIPIAGLLVAFMALYPALFGAVMGRTLARSGLRALALAPFAWVRDRVPARHALHRLSVGVPGLQPGDRCLPVAQVASLAGIYGLSALVVAVSANVARGRRRWPPRRSGACRCRRLAWRCSPAGALADVGRHARVGAVSRCGSASRRGTSPGREVGPGARQVHPRSLPDGDARGGRAAAPLWSCGPSRRRRSSSRRNRRASRDPANCARDRRVAALRQRPDRARRRRRDSTTRRFSSTPGGDTAGVYRKMQLVPFGEYVPLKSLLFFVAPLRRVRRELQPGTTPTPLCARRPDRRRDLLRGRFPGEVAPAPSRAGATCSTTITNDAWYGASSAP